MNVDIHKALPEEAEILAQILQDSADYKKSIGDHSWGGRKFGTDEVLALINRGDTYIAEAEGEPVATVTLGWADERIWGAKLGDDGRAAYIHKLAVTGQYRGQKLGETLLQWAESQAEKNGRQYLRLDCSGSNQGLCEYYKRLGFGIVGSNVLVGGYDPVLFEARVGKT